MDAPFWIHWPKLFMWLGFEGVLVGLTAYLQTHPAGVTVPPGTEGDCTLWTYDCTFRGEAADWGLQRSSGAGCERAWVGGLL